MKGYKMKTVLTKNQKKTFSRNFEDGGIVYTLKVSIRYDDECGNGHNTFAITGEIREAGRRSIISCGCLHDDIVKVFPEYEHLIKWHLCSSDGPMHYIANTVYHVGDTDCNKLRKGEYDSFTYHVVVEGSTLFKSKIFYSFRNWLHRDEAKAEAEAFLQNIKPELNPKIVQVGSGKPSEGKERELDVARSCAIWPDATDKELVSPDLKANLEQRLPALMAEFKSVIENLGFTY